MEHLVVVAPLLTVRVGVPLARSLIARAVVAACGTVTRSTIVAILKVLRRLLTIFSSVLFSLAAKQKIFFVVELLDAKRLALFSAVWNIAITWGEKTATAPSLLDQK